MDNSNTSYSLFTMENMQAYNFAQIDDTQEYKELMIKVFGRNIKNLRLKKNLTQEQISEAAGINPKYLGEIERGEKNPTALVVYKLSRSLGVSVSEILSDKDCPLIEDDVLKEVERLFAGKKKKDIQKAVRILEVFFE